MDVALTVGDFLTRAAQVHPDRVALVDEPGTPGSLGRLTYARLHRRARGMALALDAMAVGHGERDALGFIVGLYLAGLGPIQGYPYSAPAEDLKLK